MDAGTGDVIGRSTGGSGATLWAEAGLSSGVARKNSFAMRAKIRGSGSPPERNPAPGRTPESGATHERSESLVLIVLSHLDIIEHGDGIVGEY
jgi:hypothetical protein